MTLVASALAGSFVRWKSCRAGVILLLAIGMDPSYGDAVLSDNFTSFYKDDNPWSCVDNLGRIKVIPGKQLVVSDSGSIDWTALSPSVAVGDLNGDGLPDLVIADAMGYFWYLQNHGTKNVPVFTKAEVMPIWLGDSCPDVFHQDGLVTSNLVPRIQLVDLTGEGKLDLVVGTYPGKLFILHNQGSTASPVFKTPSDLDDIIIPTQHGGVLWCNYLAPFFYNWHHGGAWDLLVGDGSYSANSIYLLKNKGTNDQPSFKDDEPTKIIPGMGREHLVPQVVSWNGDGKADILSTEREGYINIFLNQTSDPSSPLPTFDQGTHVWVGGQERLGQMPTATLADLNGTGLPGLVIATSDGRISFSPNTGTAQSFQFGTPAPLKLTNFAPKILRPYGWNLDGGYGSPYDLLVCTNAQVEPKFSPPDEPGITTALRFYRDEPMPPNPTFPGHYYPKLDTRVINREGGVGLKADTRYKLSFWVKTDGTIENLKFMMFGKQPDPNQPGYSLGLITLSDAVNASSSWEHFTTTVRYQSLSDDPHAPTTFDFHLSFSGNGSLYIAALKMEDSE